MLGAPELLLILAVILIVFGAGKLPEAGAALPRAMRDFRAGIRGELPEPSAAARAPGDEETRGDAPRAARQAVRKRRGHPLRPLGLIVAAVGMLIYVADSYFLAIGLPAQITAGVVTLIGAALIFL